MKLLTKALLNEIPPLYSTEDLAEDDHPVVAKFFTPDDDWTWYVMEANAIMPDGSQKPLSEVSALSEVSDVLFFGVVDGFEVEWGYFALSELTALRGVLGLPVERDLYYAPRPWREAKLDTSFSQ